MKIQMATAAFMTITLLGLAGCKSPGPDAAPTATATIPAPARSTPAPTKTPGLSDFADEAVKARAQELLKVRTTAGFPSKEIKGPENGPAVLYLALTAQDKEVKVHALKALGATYTSSSNSETQAQADQTYADAVLSFLNSENETYQYYALEAAKDCFKENAFPAVKDKVLEMASSHPKPGGRYQAFDTLGYYGGRSDDPEAVKVYIEGFDDEPPVAFTALRWVTSGFSSATQAQEVRAALLECLKKEDPAVRGQAIESLAKAASNDPEVFYQSAVDLTKDPSPYVRGKALSALGYVKDQKVYAVVLPLLDDSAKTETKQTVTDLLGKTKTRNRTTFGQGRVDGMALKTLAKVASSVDREDKFELGKIGYKTKDEDLAREVKAAKAWLAEKGVQ